MLIDLPEIAEEHTRVRQSSLHLHRTHHHSDELSKHSKEELTDNLTGELKSTFQKD